MEVVGRYAKISLCAAAAARIGGLFNRFDLKLAPQRVDVPLLVVYPCKFHEVISDGGVGSVGAQHEVEFDLDLFRPALRRAVGLAHLKPSLALLEIGPGQLVVEEEFDIGHGREDIQQLLVEISPVSREYCLVPERVSVAEVLPGQFGLAYSSMDVVVLRSLIQFAVGAPSVDHTASHGDSRRKDIIEEVRMARMAHRINASLRKCKVDGLSKVQRGGGRVPKIWINLAPCIVKSSP